MIRLLILAAVVVGLGGCNMIGVEDWIGQRQYAHQVAACHVNPSSDPQLCAQIAPQAKP